VLKPRQLIPPLTAQTPAGRTVRAWDYKQKKSLVIAFLHAGCERCIAFADKLADHAAALTAREAIALLVFPPSPPAAIVARCSAFFVVATDMSGRSQRAYLGDDAFGTTGQRLLGVFVADRYGELYSCWTVPDEDGLPDVALALSWLGQIEVACEECGVTHWPAES
jgi:peroxiredoxin